jgi:hypothetical protein
MPPPSRSADSVQCGSLCLWLIASPRCTPLAGQTTLSTSPTPAGADRRSHGCWIVSGYRHRLASGAGSAKSSCSGRKVKGSARIHCWTLTIHRRPQWGQSQHGDMARAASRATASVPIAACPVGSRDGPRGAAGLRHAERHLQGEPHRCSREQNTLHTLSVTPYAFMRRAHLCRGENHGPGKDARELDNDPRN